MIYGAGAAMGFTPQEVDRMSLWQWQAAVNGYVDANSPKDGAKLSESEASDLFDWIETDSGAPQLVSTMTYEMTEHGLAPAGVVTFTTP